MEVSHIRSRRVVSILNTLTEYLPVLPPPLNYARGKLSGATKGPYCYFWLMIWWMHRDVFRDRYLIGIMMMFLRNHLYTKRYRYFVL